MSTTEELLKAKCKELQDTLDEICILLKGSISMDNYEPISQVQRLIRERNGLRKECDEAEQELGRVMGYPWYKDSLEHFPGSTEADGVCIGEHTTGTIAAEAADLIRKLKTQLESGPCHGT